MKGKLHTSENLSYTTVSAAYLLTAVGLGVYI
jgi:hypothetical protein